LIKELPLLGKQEYYYAVPDNKDPSDVIGAQANANIHSSVSWGSGLGLVAALGFALSTKKIAKGVVNIFK
jgi:hypothetical protein